MQKLKNIFHLLQALLANIYYRFPSRRLKVIGVTGTDGKTTTTHLIYHILKASGKRASMISTVCTPGLHTTTPSSFTVQKLLKKAADAGDKYFVLETTSHALDQNRVFGVNFMVSVMTNVTHEHLDYHITYKDYLLTKAKLLLNSSVSLINSDDQSYVRLKEILDNNKKTFYTYGFKNEADYRFDFRKENNEKIAEFNAYNYLSAFSVCRVLGIPGKEIATALQNFKLPTGRQDILYDKDFTVISDFAHTPNSLHAVLKNLKGKLHGSEGRLIHVFGSAGLRDATKRPLMGEESAKYADIIVLTEEDYRTEDPATICQQIAVGIPSSKQPLVILNREEAVKKALSLAKKGDIVIITGKGHEQSLCRGDKEFPWDERKVVLKFLKQIYD